MWMGTKLFLLQKSGKGRRLGWQLSVTTATENATSARDLDAPSKVPPGFKLSETPEFTEAQSRSISESVKNPQALGSRDGKI